MQRALKNNFYTVIVRPGVSKMLPICTNSFREKDTFGKYFG